MYGLTCAGIAGGVLEEAFRRGDFSEGFLKGYERGWKGEIGKGIRAGLAFRRIYKGMGNQGIELAFRTGKRLGFLMNKLDMDLLKGASQQAGT